jgi:hypothetical protein
MKIRYGRLVGIAALTAAAALASGPLWAGQDVDIVEANSENTLLGMHLLNSTFRDVLKKYGQPSEIQAGGPFAPTPPPGKAASSSGMGGMMGGGMMGIKGGGMMGMRPPGSGGGGSGGGMGGAPGMGGGGNKKQTSKNGFPGDNGGAGGMGGPGSGGGMRPGMGSPMSGGPGSGGGMRPGMGSPMSGGGPGSGGGLPGFGPGLPGMGAPGIEGEGNEGGPGELGAGAESTEDNPPVKETTWWYHDHQTGLHMAFVFNRVGQIIQIGEYGPKKLQKMHGVLVPNAGATRRGLVLGNSMGSVIGKYGWSLDGAHSADNVILRFGHTDKVAFQMVHNAILGITIGVTRSRPAVVE